MRAFHNDPSVKQRYLNQVKYRQETTQEQDWDEYNGGAMGYILNNDITEFDIDMHKWFEETLNIPREMSQILSCLFNESSYAFIWSKGNGKYLTGRFLESIPVGFEAWSIFYNDFKIYLLEKCTPYGEPEMKKFLAQSIELLKNGMKLSNYNEHVEKWEKQIARWEHTPLWGANDSAQYSLSKAITSLQHRDVSKIINHTHSALISFNEHDEAGILREIEIVNDWVIGYFNRQIVKPEIKITKYMVSA